MANDAEGQSRMTIGQRLEVAGLRLHQWVYERSRGWVGHGLIGSPSLLLRTTGRRSGKVRTSALIYARDGDAYVLVASNGGQDRPTAWQRNIEADPRVEVQIARRKFAGIARVVEASNPDYPRLWAIANRGNRNRYAGYQKRTSRPIPVVVVTAAGPAQATTAQNHEHER